MFKFHSLEIIIEFINDFICKVFGFLKPNRLYVLRIYNLKKI